MESSAEPLDDNDKSIKELEAHCIGNEMHGINIRIPTRNAEESLCKKPQDNDPNGKSTVLPPTQVRDGVGNVDDHTLLTDTGAAIADSLEMDKASLPESSSGVNDSDQKEYVPWEDEDLDSQADLIESDSIGTS